MALTSTLYNFEIILSDIDRGVYQQLKLAVARHPSETMEYLAARVVAYCLEFEEGLVFSRGLSETEEPAIWLKHPDGRIKTWVEIGAPAAARLHKAAKTAERVAVYCHKNPAALMQQLGREKIHRAEQVPIYSFDADFFPRLTALLDRRTKAAISVNDRQLYIEIAGESVYTTIGQQAAS